MQVRLLGPVDLIHQGQAIQVPGARRQSVMATLALRAGDVVSVDKIVDAVWDDDPPATARNTVQAHMSALRKLLGDDGSLISHAPGYRLVLPSPATDLAHVQVLLAQVAKVPSPADRVGPLSEAVACWRGNPLAGTAPSAYLGRHAEVLAELELSTRESLLVDRLRLGEHREVIPELQTLLADAPLRERPVQLLMTALYRSGRSSEALRAYRNLTKTLRIELEAEPSARTRSVYRRIVDHDLSLLVPPKQPDPSAVPRHALPTGQALLARPLRPLIGRTVELADATELLRRERLLSVIGMGGVGKTRLARELMHQLGESSTVVRHAVDLSAAPPGRLTEAVAAALGVVAEPGVPVEAAIAAVLGIVEGSTTQAAASVLLLDNCDHLVPEAAVLVADLIGRTDTVRVIVTSREPLRVECETCLVLTPLAEPDALDLLVDRARRADAAFALGPHNEASLAELCRHVGGLPLALEILGPRLRAHTAAELARALDGRVLTWPDPRREISDRHRTLRSVMEQSVALLPEPEVAALEKLSWLDGGGWFDEVSQLCDPDRDTGEDLIVALLDRSLLIRTETNQRTRISMHSLVRAYVREQADRAGHADALAARHADWMTRLVVDAATHWHRASENEVLEARRVDEGNLRAMLEWTRNRHPERLASLVARLWWYWFRVGAAEDGRRWARSAIAGATPGTRERALAHAAAGYLAWLVDDYDDARSSAEAALADPGADARVRGFASGVVARALGDSGDFLGAAAAARRGVAAYESCSDSWGTAWLRRVVAAALFYGKDGDVSEPLAVCRQAREEFAAVGDDWGVAGALDLESRIVAESGDQSELVVLLAERALTLMEQCGDTSGQRYALQHLGEVSLATGAWESAHSYATKELDLAQRHGYQVGALQAVLLLEDVARAQGTGADVDHWRQRAATLVDALGPAAEVSLAGAAQRRSVCSPGTVSCASQTAGP